MTETNLPDSPAEEGAAEQQESRFRVLRRPPVIVALTVVLVFLLYMLVMAVLSQKVPRQTSVAGVQIGGMSAEAATRTLDKELQATTTEPVVVEVGEVQGELDPGAAGLEFDAAATVNQVTGFTLSPVRFWQHVAGGPKVAPVSSADEPALRSQLDGMGGDFAVAPVDGDIAFEGADPVVTTAEDGLEVDLDQAVEVVAAQWIVGPRPLPLPTKATPPAVSQEETQRALREEAEPLVAAPVSVRVEDGESAQLEPAELAAAASFEAESSRLILNLDGEMLVEDLREKIPELENSAVDATIELTGEGPQIKPHVPGAKVDTKVLTGGIIEAIGTEERTVEIAFTDVDAEVTTADMEALKIVEPISEFSTYLTADAVRTENIRTGAAAVSGVILKPGDTFSLLETLGPITPENGYGNAGVIVDGQIVDGLGGGLSQLATTLYNAVFFSGLEDVEHTPHTQYIPRYPEGREATIATPSLDLKFRNDSDYGVLVESWVDEGQVHVRFWGTKVWDIESQTSGRSGIVQPKTVKSNRPGCEPSGAGEPGFQVYVDRIFYKDGEYVKTDSYGWRYQPVNAVKCG